MVLSFPCPNVDHQGPVSGSRPWGGVQRRASGGRTFVHMQYHLFDGKGAWADTEVEKYQLYIVGLTSMHGKGSETSLLADRYRQAKCSAVVPFAQAKTQM